MSQTPDVARLAERGGRRWQIGTAQTVEWIQTGFRRGLTIASSVPPVFDGYATVVDPWDEDEDSFLWRFDRTLSSVPIPDGLWLEPRHAQARADSHGWQVQERLVDHLRQFGSSSWWLGYLDTGSADVVFESVPTVPLYVGWPYRLVQAGPNQALSWRALLPDLVFPEDHSWCVSSGWDDSWTSIGGPVDLIAGLVSDQLVSARPVNAEEDATPPGHIAI